MIRRDVLDSEGQPSWLLISQVEHARLSGALAADWGAAAFPALEPRDELLLAILRHDDGWHAWERHPQVDPASGVPRDFTEMPLGDSLVIWRDSIERVAGLSLLGGYVVAGHFLYLLTQSAIWLEHGTRQPAAARQWAADFEAQRQQWLDDWRAEDPAQHTAAAAQSGIAWLQFFDRLSLWLCMARQTKETQLPAPGGATLRMIPVDDQTVQLEPWPLQCGCVEVVLGGRLVPARRYADAEDLAAQGGTASAVRLRLLPPTDSSRK